MMTQTQIDPKAAEEYVKAKWGWIHCCDGSYRDYKRGTILLQDTRNHWLEFRSWLAAYNFTLERERAIREKQEEISLVLNSMPLQIVLIGNTPLPNVGEVKHRLLSVLTAQLDDLRKGMR